MPRGILALFAIFVLAAPRPYAQAPQPPAGRGRGVQGPPQITQISGSLYKVSTSGVVVTNTVFLVTPEGIILADPENTQLTTYLKDEFARRFRVPVRYVIYSHYHWDHASGGAVFADTARFVAHAKMPELLNAPFSVAPPPGDTRDKNGDNRFSLDETFTATRANFGRFDKNGDGFLTHEEINADIRPPDTTFTGNRHVITLGGKRVELVYTGGRHTADMIDMYFPDERTLFAGDYVWINRICCGFGFDMVPLPQWIASLKALERLDFDTLVNSHWESGTKADLIAFREYLEDLNATVSAGIAAGKSREELQRTITLEKYSRYAGYPDQVPQMVASAYDSLIRLRQGRTRAAAGRILRPNAVIHSVADLDRSIAFYRDAVGLTLDPSPAFPSGASRELGALTRAPGATLRTATLTVPGGDVRLTLVQFSGVDARPIPPRLQDPGNVKLVVRVRDMDAAFERVRAHVGGVYTEGGAPIRPEGAAAVNRAVIMRDPDGYPLEFAFQGGPVATDVPASSNVIGGWATFIVGDVNATLEFYRDRLGFQPTGVPTTLSPAVLSLQGVPTATGSMSVGMKPPGAAATWRLYDFRNVERTRLAGRLQDPGTAAVSFLVDDVSALLSRLKAAGVAAEDGGAVRIDGGMRAFIRDPNGLLVELVELVDAGAGN